MQGRIKHDRMPVGEADPRPDFLAAHRLYPYRAEPLIWMCWHHHKMMGSCGPGPQQETCWLRERAAAFYYSRKAAALPMPEVTSSPLTATHNSMQPSQPMMATCLHYCCSFGWGA